MIRKDTILAWPMIGFMVLFFLAPLLLLLGISLRGADGGWGLGNFVAFLADPFQRGVLVRTLLLGFKVDRAGQACSPCRSSCSTGTPARGCAALILICALLPMLTATWSAPSPGS